MRKSSHKIVRAVAAVAKKTAAVGKVLPDLSIPKFLDRTKGKTDAQINAERETRLKQREQPARGVTSPSPKASNLTAADHKAIAELKAAKAQPSPLDKVQRPLRETTAPLGDKTAKQLAKAKPAKVEPKKVEAKKPDKKAARSAKSKAKVDIMIAALQRKNGVTNADWLKIGVARPSSATLDLACNARGLKLKIVKKDGEPTRYMI